MSDFIEYAQSLAPNMLRVFARGDTLAYDQHNRSTTPGAGNFWVPNEHQGIQCKTAPITIGKGNEQLTTEGTLFVECTPLKDAGPNHTQRIMEKHVGVPESWRFYILKTPARYLVFGTAGVLPTLTYDWRGKTCLAVVFRPGQAPLFYAEGAFIGIGSLVHTVVPADVDISLGSYHVPQEPLLSPMYVAGLFPVLTGQQIFNLHKKFLAMPPVDRTSPVVGRKIASRPPTPELDAKCTEVFAMSKNLDDGKIHGLKGVSEGTIAGHIGVKNDGLIYPGAISCNSDAPVVTLSNAAQMVTLDNGAVEQIFTPKFDTIPSQRWTFACNASLRSYISMAGPTFYATKGQPLQILPSVTANPHARHLTNLLLTWWLDGATRRFQFFIDGVSQGTGTYTDNTVPSQASLFLATLSAPGQLHLTRTYNTRITPDEARTLYLQHAVIADELNSRNFPPVSLANVTAGDCGPWRVMSGILTWQEDGAKRKLVSGQVNSAARYTSQQAYGGWYWKLKGLDTYYVPLSSAAVAVSGSWNGYYVYLSAAGAVRLYRRTGAASVLIQNTVDGFVAAGVEYSLFLSRRSDGLFTLWVKGGAYAVWTQALTVLDATHTVSVAHTCSLPSGAEISKVLRFPLGGTLTPNEVPELRDAA